MKGDEKKHPEDAIKGALDALIKQFGNRFDFVRELVQNSLDAGTAEVEVWTAYYAGTPGVCEIHVDDNGKGMDESIIDNGLTRLFSSTKEDDLTCIGKFGIGFASVFSLDPEGVLVKTARGGERWEVFFDKAHSVEKTALDEPIEGTKITVFKAMSESEYRDTSRQVFEMLKFWCRYAEQNILFKDTASLEEESDKPSEAPSGRRRRGRGKTAGILINEPLTVEGDFPIRVKKGEAEIAMAFSALLDTPTYGFYNRGLTLTETAQSEVLGWAEPFFRNVSFRIKSPHLEHTLTRDTILMDENYQKALTVLIETAREELVENLLNEVEREAARAPVNGKMSDAYMRGQRCLFSLNREIDPVFGIGEKIKDAYDTALEHLSRTAAALFRPERERRPDQKSVDASNRKLFRRCFGEPVTLAEIQGALKATENRLILSDRESPAVHELFEHDKPVYFAPRQSGAEAFFSARLGFANSRIQDDKRVFSVAFDAWLVDFLQAKDLSESERALFDTLSELGRVAQMVLVPVNFLGDDPNLYNLGAPLVDKRIAVRLPVSSPKATTVAVDIRGKMFQKLSQMYADEKERNVALLLAVGEAARWCGNDAEAEAALRLFAEEVL